jgi:hypothetical protein
MSRPSREIRAFYDEHSVRVYQAYSDVIADSALTHQTFVSPPFSMTRMSGILNAICTTIRSRIEQSRSAFVVRL